jgi:hypothetical protein
MEVIRGVWLRKLAWVIPWGWVRGIRWFLRVLIVGLYFSSYSKRFELTSDHIQYSDLHIHFSALFNYYVANSNPSWPVYIFEYYYSIDETRFVFLKYLGVSCDAYLPNVLYTQWRAFWKFVLCYGAQSLYLRIFLSEFSCVCFYLVLGKLWVDVVGASSKLNGDINTCNKF